MTTPVEEPSDAHLIARTREGDMNAYDQLYRRHYDDASRVARIVTNNSDEAQDIVAEAFTRILTRLRDGGGPDSDLTPYLRTVVRRLAIDRHRGSQRDGRPADPSVLDILPRADDPMARATDRHLVRQAFETLPDRWQQVLWHTEIEGRSPASIAASLGSTPNAVAALAYRAREGLRQAYLAVNLSSDVRAECRPYAPKVAAYVRGTLSAQHTRAVTTHLGECEFCRERRDELLLLVSDLRATLWPALLLPAAAAAATATGVVAAGVTAGSASAAGTGSAASVGSTASTTSAAPPAKSLRQLSRLGRKVLVGAAGVVAAGIIVAGASMMMSGSEESTGGSAAPAGSTDPGPGPTTPGGGADEGPSEPAGPTDPAAVPGDAERDVPDAADPPADDQQVPVSNPDPRRPGSTQEAPGTVPGAGPADEPSDRDEPPAADDEPGTPPDVSTEQPSTTARAGQPVTLRVNVSGSPEPALTWQTREPATITGATDGRPRGFAPASRQGWADIPGATRDTLTIRNPTSSDDGRQYRVVATNTHGTEVTEAIVLRVEYAPELTAHPGSVTVTEGGSVTFTASARANPAPADVRWQRRKGDGAWQPAGSGTVSQNGTNATLRIAAAAKDLNEYEYRAVFANKIGTADSRPAGLTVHWAPTVTAHPTDAEVSTGETAVFEAVAQAGNPARTTFQWQVDDGSGWRDLGDAQTGNTARRTVDVSTISQDKSRYRVVFANATGTTHSDSAVLRVFASGAIAMHHAGLPGGKQCVQPIGGEIRLGDCGSPDPPIWHVHTDHTVRWPNGSGGRCLGVDLDGYPHPNAGSTTHEPCTPGDTGQRWFFDVASSASQPISSAHQGLCLDVLGGVSPNQRLIAYPCHGGPNQKFRFEPRPS